MLSRTRDKGNGECIGMGRIALLSGMFKYSASVQVPFVPLYNPKKVNRWV